MKNSNFLVLITFVLSILLFTSSSFAKNMGVRYGRTTSDPRLNQYDLYLSADLPLSKTYESNWTLRSDIEGIFSVLEGESESSVKPSVMAKMIYTSPKQRFDYLGGFGVGFLLGETQFGEQDLGGPLFFQGTLGVRIGLTKSLFTGLRYYHQSNFSIYDSNDSLNMIQLELVWEF